MRRAGRDDGFTLIELLGVVMILGILAAIAVPQFLSQREKAHKSVLAADLRAAAMTAEEYVLEEGHYPTAIVAAPVPAVRAPDTLYHRKSESVATVALVPLADDGTPAVSAAPPAICLEMATTTGVVQSWNTHLGGLQPAGVACPS